MLNIYHAPMTRSCRVIWVCEELGIPYEIEKIPFNADFRFSPEWLAKNPVGKVPVLEDGELMMFESGAMVQYILDRYGDGRLQPERGTPDHALYLQWSWFAESTFARPAGEIINHRRHFDPEIPEVVEEMKVRTGQCAEAVNDAVRDREYLLGEFTGADIMMAYSLMLCEAFAPWVDCPETDRYWQSLLARPAAQTAFQDFLKGG